MQDLFSYMQLHSADISSKQTKRSFTQRSRRFSKNAISFAIAASSTYLYHPTVLADTNEAANVANHKSASMEVISIYGSQDKKPVYPGTDGQILETNRAGFLGDKYALDMPFSAISYTEKYIKDNQASDISAVISVTDPAVNISNNSGESRESYSIRGFSSNSNDATVNGLAGMAPYYRSATEMYERVDVLKGPSAMLNGMAPNGSIGGAVNLVTKRATEKPLTRLTTKYMSDSQVGGHLDIGRRYGTNKQFGIRVNGAYLSGDGTINHQENQSQLGAIALDWRSDDIRLSADFYHTKETVDAPTRGITFAPGVDILNPPSNETLLNPSWNFYKSETKGAITRAEYDINDRVSVYASAGITEWDYHGLSADKAEVYNNAGDMKTTLGGVSDDNERRALDLGLNGRFETGSIGHDLVTNITRYDEAYNLYATRFRGITVDSKLYDPHWGTRPELDLNYPLLLTTETTLSSIGFADTLSFNQGQYLFTLGARYQQVETEQTGGMLSTGAEYDESAVTPSFALLVKLTDNISAYANYIEGLNKGATAPTTANNSGEIFSPYKTKQKEMGLKIDHGTFTHSLSLYEITRPSSYTDSETNVFGYYGEQRNRGVEWSFFGSPLDDIRLIGGLAYIDAELVKTKDGGNNGNQAAGVPDWQAKLGAEWDPLFIQNLTLTANASALSKQYIENENLRSIPGYTLLGIGARYTTTVNELPFTVRANISNLTDKDAWTTASYNDLSLIEGRRITLSASVDF
ncbi:ferric anguibactin receptor [Salinivibrio sp. SS3]|uniref:TonB-dependent receptor n=1 Tax=Salinivibrio sp. SS3 TaxID=1895021 RepID=UPI000847FC0D|nr:TonB-dependent siderophore receptor [Salinivibrio sp. BNH]ODP99483.1 ferric anguibactin receptor [Salinivibrio sp. BNH]